MYQKNYILLFVLNMICSAVLSLSKTYLNKVEEVREKPIETLVSVELTQRTEGLYKPVIEYEILEPEYVIDVSGEDIDVLMRIVEAEAGCEDRTGKLLVADVIINRVKDKHFPDTVKKVVYQKDNNVTQFSPVSDGKINSVEVSDETREVVYSALLGEDVSDGALYFVARNIADPERLKWFDSNLTLLFTYGGHDFFV